MAVGGAYLPDPDPERLAQAYAAQPLSQGLRYGVEAHSDLLDRGLQFGKHLVLDTLGIDPADPSDASHDDRLPPVLANERYGVDGYLRFNEPTTAEDAAWLSSQAQERRYRDTVLTNTRSTPLRDIGAGLVGSLTDPLGLALMAGTGFIGEAGLAAAGIEHVGEAGLIASRLGKVGNAAIEAGFQTGKGLAYNAPYVAVSGALSNYAGDDYTMGDGLRDMAAGAIFHLGGHYGGRALDALLGRARAAPEGGSGPTAAGTPPDAVTALPAASRAGAFAKALDDVAGDRPVDVGQYVQREIEPPSLSRLDEPSAESSLASFRPLDEARAVTPRGTEVPVRYGLVEMRDLTTSHSNDLQVNPDYPPELQPRDRGRAGAQARNHALESELNPKLLMRDISAGGGAPIVAPDGTVESGNGRTIALRRSAANGTAAYARYVAELKAQGFDTEGLAQPVLVRMRTEPMEGAQRAGLAREMNADVTERMSATEQALQDAGRLDDSLAKIPDGGGIRDRDFTRDFIARVAPDQQNLFVDKDGRLSPEGERRIKAAVLARAYGDPRLVGQIFEGEETPTRKFGEALADAAPAWARMRALAESGQIPRALDLTDALTGAMDLVRFAKEEKLDLGELLAERLGQKELFGGEAISPATEGFLRLMYRDEAFKKPLAGDKLAAALKDYARQAGDVTPGENLFGETPDEGTARAIIRTVREKFAAGDAGKIDLRAPGKADGGAAGAEPRPVVIDLREPGEGGDGQRPGLPPEDGGGAGGEGQPQRLTGDQIIAADPELNALAEDTDRLAADNGVKEEPAPERQQPNTVAEALRAAAVCLAGELG